jgi:hypothetical protein
MSGGQRVMLVAAKLASSLGVTGEGQVCMVPVELQTFKDWDNRQVGKRKWYRASFWGVLHLPWGKKSETGLKWPLENTWAGNKFKSQDSEPSPGPRLEPISLCHMEIFLTCGKGGCRANCITKAEWNKETESPLWEQKGLSLRGESSGLWDKESRGQGL